MERKQIKTMFCDNCKWHNSLSTKCISCQLSSEGPTNFEQRDAKTLDEIMRNRITPSYQDVFGGAIPRPAKIDPMEQQQSLLHIGLDQMAHAAETGEAVKVTELIADEYVDFVKTFTLAHNNDSVDKHINGWLKEHPEVTIISIIPIIQTKSVDIQPKVMIHCRRPKDIELPSEEAAND